MKEDIELAREGFAEFVARTGIKRERDRLHKKILLTGAFALTIAASLAAGVLLTKWNSAEDDWIQVSTSYAQTRSVALPDGSTVKLNSCSQIMYPKSFCGRTRKVMLVGEAFFDVSKDIKRQFVVRAGNMDIIVHGTQFNVTSYLSDEEDEVALVEGSVEMQLRDGRSSIFLKPGEMFKYDKTNNTTECRPFAANYFKEVIASDGLQFNNEKLSDIVATLNRRFSTNIIIENEKLNSMRFFASFINGEDADMILSALNLNDSFKITRKGNVIFIN